MIGELAAQRLVVQAVMSYAVPNTPYSKNSDDDQLLDDVDNLFRPSCATTQSTTLPMPDGSTSAQMGSTNCIHRIL